MYSLISRIIFLVLLTSILLTAGVFSSVNAQLLGNNSTSNSQNASEVPTSQKKPYGIRITSPVNGEEVYINGTNYFDKNGDNLSFKGFSVSDKNNSSSCIVSMIANSVKPYQSTNATGPAGVNDYSTWNYDFSTNYVPLKEGSNKITSKLTCQPGNNNAYYSVNVTGLKFNGTLPSKIEKPILVVSTPANNTGPIKLTTTDAIPAHVGTSANILIFSPTPGEKVDIDKPIVINGTSAYPSNGNCEVLVSEGSDGPQLIAPNSVNQSSNFKKASATGKNGTSDFTTWNLNLEPGQSNIKNGSQSITAKLQCFSPTQFAKISKVNIVGESSKPIETKSMGVNIDKTGSGNSQNIVVTVKDSLTDNPINGASLIGSMNDDSFSGTTNSNGEYSKSIPSNVLSSSSSLDVTVTANADGYKSKKSNTSFDISSANDTPKAIVSKDSSSDIKERDMAAKIFDDVQKQLSKQGINIPLPFG
jgi:hypothetical protein